MIIGCEMKEYIRGAKKVSNEFRKSTRHSEVKKVKLSAMIDLAADIESCGLIRSEEAAVETRDDLVDIRFSTGKGKIGLLISVGDLEKILRAAL